VAVKIGPVKSKVHQAGRRNRMNKSLFFIHLMEGRAACVSSSFLNSRKHKQKQKTAFDKNVNGLLKQMTLFLSKVISGVLGLFM